MITICTFLLLLLQLTTICHGLSSSSPPPSRNNNNNKNNNNNNQNNNNSGMPTTENLAAAVLVPGYLTGANELKSLQSNLEKQGLLTVTVPMASWHWVSVVGGRSVRPILERIDFTVQHLIAQLERIEEQKEEMDQPFPTFQYSLLDAWRDFQENPGGVAEVGGSSLPNLYPKDVRPRGKFPMPVVDDDLVVANKSQKKIALIGHSAGGWISRIYLSEQEYGGKVYHGSRYVHSLVTLGTPHASAPGPAFAGISWINEQEKQFVPKSKVRTLAVAGKGFSGDQWGGMTKGAYSFCCPDGSDGATYDGDGMTPIFSSLAMPNSESLILPQEKVNHFGWTDVGWVGKQVAPELYQDMETNQSPWYGSDEVVAEWLPWILEGVTNN
ncbi:unnamed protein product [Cylindrotheca closterium]|uniref:GPI inositol-deacylase n=1 Tax=Cylindrotheca closterium TaxID=2856 RepID=A0AAD2CN76_9STRA|nr:unnamed protein product [Cylindrotheca closterium]